MTLVNELLNKITFKADTAAIAQAQSAMAGFNSTLKMSAVGFAGIAAAAAGVFKFIQSGAGEMEQQEIAFETMLGSAEKSAKLIKDIRDFAAKTPFNTIEVIKYSKSLIGANVEHNKIIDTLTYMGNIAAGVGKDKLPTLIAAFRKIKAKGRVELEALNMVMDAGIPIIDVFAKKMGVSNQEVFKLITKGRISFKDFENAMRSLSESKFDKMMEKLSTTFAGVWSNIIDVIERVRDSIGKRLLPEATKTLKNILVWIEKNEEAIVKFGVKIFENLIPALKWATILLASFAAASFLINIGKMVSEMSKLAKGITTVGNSALITQLKLLGIGILFAAAVAALILIVDELWLTMTDPRADTYLRDLINRFKKDFPEAFEITRRAFTFVFDSIFYTINKIVGGLRALFGWLIKVSTGNDGAYEGALRFLEENEKSYGMTQSDVFSSLPSSASSVKPVSPMSTPSAFRGNEIRNMNQNVTNNIYTSESGEAAKRAMEQATIQLQLRAKGL